MKRVLTLPEKARVDPVILFTVLMLLTVGLVMVNSSSAIVALERYKDPYYFLKRQSVWLALGLVAIKNAVLTAASRFSPPSASSYPRRSGLSSS